MSHFLLTLVCPDQRGIVAAVSATLANLDANIEHSSQFSDPTSQTFCIRTRFELQAKQASEQELTDQLQPVASELQAQIKVRSENHTKRALVMVSQYDHCLVDLLYRVRTSELNLEIPVVVSNHTNVEQTVLSEGIQFHHVPVANKSTAETKLHELIATHNIDFVILARYMQILSPELCARYRGRIINIHHSFLPGFKGANPYRRAWERGVKVIGATAHYVTAQLDEGPIIAQATEPVTHRDTAADMMVRGKDIERKVLAQAVKAYSEDRIFLLGDGDVSRTVVFE